MTKRASDIDIKPHRRDYLPQRFSVFPEKSNDARMVLAHEQNILEDSIVSIIITDNLPTYHREDLRAFGKRFSQS